MLEPDGTERDRNRLAAALRELRRAAGLSGERLAARVAMSQSKISRIESGRTVPTVVDVERILKALAVPPEVGQEILSLARAANVEYVSWRSYARMGIWRKQAEIKALTEASSTVRQFLPAIPSGLLQTREYARAVLTPGVRGRPARDVERAVRARLDSQEALNDQKRRFYFLLTEQALRLQRAAAHVMVDQLRHMAHISTRPNIELAILPNGVLVNETPLNVFVVYDDRLVIVELFSGEIALRDRRDVDHHRNVFDHFRSRAVVGEQARDLLESSAERFRRAGG
ncbi:Helix-turn-helix domain-containing protein [Streptoalloteichus tenebrarius]|uniref:Helix-turn-helix domain-containing protein n=1 Tax=Streptoalloteichus tenebrarius (strain ATCC 17920 / DSM 40477 / JCM 4838 / CBS 697.72 / NBRC 16177 / NCIMB 11028 / NRRL B-12390 / A12253. 1 / ISP 5477) TaxID=1933 RepID=A0ABT1I3Z2_STRSD|nr:helix-turn-helix transcriptional regulator [Streptoalloteichus tenebrarius]MCP2262487.1 Helix-turn-helix domain-containing protein [Streptoalloteichus tenebrarius]BFF01544.1 helix-turn-helix transcriptional regulator [Streptoalloteichus tenebrarius]